MELVELRNNISSSKFHMDIKETYSSFNLNEDTNIFIESFDGINFSINTLNRHSLEMETLEEIVVKTTDDLNYNISKVIDEIYDFTI